MLENSYGIAKRFEFVAGVIERLHPLRVLDIGCGTGANLTAPLARRFPNVEFVGLDSDPASIEFARRAGPALNTRYYIEAVEDIGHFDLVIASEVIEHVELPDQFLAYLRDRLNIDGRVVLTLPNGFGPFELMSLVETLFHLSGIYAVLRWCKHRLSDQTPSVPAVDSLAISPHINFFSYAEIHSAIAFAGFEVEVMRPRTLFAGLGFDQLMTAPRLIAWNARIADRLPAQLASGWMFVLVPACTASATAYRRGVYARFRRYLNEKRWHLR
ncbi:class I SAM-dependent methyltransferase [Laribacter hongkongensis]|uniref:class I SAM-dependent methyltransferase n=1 Tax=Laribacter hongkongensis TaxID=168471 RepID=UPI001EFE5390|nr:class I SAM-dependent methyltransferase [Laribacter hongkongensis]MCG9059544.1 class I SAM-dependent methyltransferase [Laribacter hongkongensis]MCG9086582.1 class I SAM-dependent methyltransferase [Laribacter hongkongensis]